VTTPIEKRGEKKEKETEKQRKRKMKAVLIHSAHAMSVGAAMSNIRGASDSFR
jgi:hypothetical protein